MPKSFLKKILPQKHELDFVFDTFSKTKWIIFFSSIAILILTVLILIFNLNQKILVSVPSSGGRTIEGVIGTPRFINPLLAISETDKDLTALVYSGLMRRDASGAIIPDIAQEYTVSTDGLTYTFSIKEDAVFHDGTPVTSADVLYTINTAKDPLIKSPKKINWDGVSIETPDEMTVVFSLKQRYPSFLENTTLGILPAHLWKNTTSEQFSLSNLNIRPVGSGPFQVKKVKQSSSGIPESYELVSFSKFIFGKPYLDSIIFNFYANENELINAFVSGRVNSINSISSKKARELDPQKYAIKTVTLPRVFGLYLDPTQNKIFTDITVVTALELVVSKKNIIETVLGGYGTPIDSPIPESIIPRDPQSPVIDQDLEKAASLLSKNGWAKNENGIWQKKTTVNKKTTTTLLEFSISTSDTPELKEAANQMRDDFNAFGAQVTVKVFEIGALNQNVIRPRKFEALFFGQVINYDTDLFAFWHSSQRRDPGLNISQYASVRADKNLETASGTLDNEQRTALYKTVANEIKKDKPAFFVYSPAFIYVSNGSIKNNELVTITTASDRFSEVWKWYQKEEFVWPIFANKSK